MPGKSQGSLQPRLNRPIEYIRPKQCCPLLVQPDSSGQPDFCECNNEVVGGGVVFFFLLLGVGSFVLLSLQSALLLFLTVL